MENLKHTDPDKSWYFLENRKWIGPYDEESILQLYESDRIRNKTMLKNFATQTTVRMNRFFEEHSAEDDFDDIPDASPECVREIPYEPAKKHRAPRLFLKVTAGIAAVFSLLGGSGFLFFSMAKTTSAPSIRILDYSGNKNEGEIPQSENFKVMLTDAYGAERLLDKDEMKRYLLLKTNIPMKYDNDELYILLYKKDDLHLYGEYTLRAESRALRAETDLKPAETAKEKQESNKEDIHNDEQIEPEEIEPEQASQEYYPTESPIIYEPAPEIVPVISETPQVEPAPRMVWITPDGCYYDEYPSHKADKNPAYVTYEMAMNNNYKTEAERNAIIENIYAQNPDLPVVN